MPASNPLCVVDKGVLQGRYQSSAFPAELYVDTHPTKKGAALVQLFGHEFEIFGGHVIAFPAQEGGGMVSIEYERQFSAEEIEEFELVLEDHGTVKVGWPTKIKALAAAEQHAKGYNHQAKKVDKTWRVACSRTLTRTTYQIVRPTDRIVEVNGVRIKAQMAGAVSHHHGTIVDTGGTNDE